MTIDTGTFSAVQLVLLWGILQTFGLEYLWWVKDWFGALAPNKKKTVNAAGVFILAAGAYVLSLFGVINAFTPDLAGAVAALGAFFAALGINTGVHLATKRSV